MIRKLQKADTDQVMQIWLNGNVEAHPFVPKDYWVSNYEMVREQLLEADVFVYEACLLYTSWWIRGWLQIRWFLRLDMTLII